MVCSRGSGGRLTRHQTVPQVILPMLIILHIVPFELAPPAAAALLADAGDEVHAGRGGQAWPAGEEVGCDFMVSGCLAGWASKVDGNVGCGHCNG